ncbi:winged helix-turn-helix domain-containing protein [Halorubrum sp. AD140]|uniref:winged helix-turn-helix domain-containing protein n=1 Tax=Halorubrum sp. AD140 TaxID=3050073 RepID=UPI002ACCBBAF|nr:winged helix-turn-helix domain-containing protein [Halorubrum sp. AD140]MDZ5810055.1 winged helix-turn-helix domain-containing protein [Halorubrum sp. AD140]
MTDDDSSQNDSLLDLGANRGDPLSDINEHDQDLASMSAEGKKALALEKVRRAVRKHGEDGISVTEIMEVTGLTRKTVSSHLDRLRNLREIYRQKKGKQMFLYYPNGKPLHGVGREYIECSDGETGIEIQLAKGKNDDLYFHVTEKRFSLLEGETSEGAIIFPMEDLDKVFKGLNSLSEEVDQDHVHN